MANVDGAPERATQGIEADTLDAMDGDRVRFEHTGNPLFAWQAWASWRALNRKHARERVIPLPMPEWVGVCLDGSVARLLILASGHAFYGTGATTGQPAQAGGCVLPPRHREPRITPGEAMKRVPAALGLIDKRWNAFRRLQELNSQEIDEMSVELYKGTEPRVGDGRAFEMLCEDKGVGDVRDLRRRVARARKARGVKLVQYIL
jgi:hypothetical protein